MSPVIPEVEIDSKVLRAIRDSVWLLRSVKIVAFNENTRDWRTHLVTDSQNKKVNIYIVLGEEIIDWIETHDSRFYNSITQNCYVFAEEMEVLFLLRWA